MAGATANIQYLLAGVRVQQVDDRLTVFVDEPVAVIVVVGFPVAAGMPVLTMASRHTDGGSARVSRRLRSPFGRRLSHRRKCRPVLGNLPSEDGALDSHRRDIDAEHLGHVVGVHLL